MARRVFYSFHYEADGWRASQVRNAGVVEGNRPCSDNDWESITAGGAGAIQKWIDGQLRGRSCMVVLIGRETAGRKWINYEIEKAWADGKGVVGVHIHDLRDAKGDQTTKGDNPFDELTIDDGQTALSSIAMVYDPPHSTGTGAYEHITSNLARWVEEAIQIRDEHGAS